jgi:hypothetical protein
MGSAMSDTLREHQGEPASTATRAAPSASAPAAYDAFLS